MKNATFLILQKIQTQLGDITTRLDRVETAQVVLREEMAAGFRAVREELTTEVGTLRDELGDVREEMQVGFKAIMKQNDRRFLDHEARIRALERRR